jgi:hypothetical protein
MEEERIKQAVLSAVGRSDLARLLAGELTDPVGPATPAAPPTPAPAPGTQRLLSRVVLGDLLDDAILGARPQDRTFPLRLFFSELSALLGGEDPRAELAFTLASGLNFFFRASMDDEAKVRIGLEVSRQLYALAEAAELEAELLAKASPLLAALMTSELSRARFESVDHVRIYDSQIHERTAGSDPTASRVVRAASFLCRIQANNAVKAKAQVVT